MKIIVITLIESFNGIFNVLIVIGLLWLLLSFKMLYNIG